MKIVSELLGSSIYNEFREVIFAWEKDAFFVENWPEKTLPGPKGAAGGNTESHTAHTQSTRSPAAVLTL